MSLHKQFKTDTKKETEGVLISYEGAANEDGTFPSFRVLRRGVQNARYVKAIERESAPYRRLMELGTLPAEVEQKVLRRVFCTSVLIGWENVYTEKKEVLPFTFDNAMNLFNELPELYLDLSEQAGKLSSFRIETLESDAKN